MSKRRGKGVARAGLIAALDVGSSKIACLIARPDDDGQLDVVGIGHQVSRGMKNGNIVDMAALEHAVAATVEAAEQLAQENVREVVLGMAGGSPESKLISFDVAISGHEIGDGDLRRALDPTWLYARQPDDRRIVHTLPVGFSINGNRGVRDPRRMFGEKLGVDMHIITQASSAVRNIESCVTRCQLEIESHVVAPYASGLSTLVEDEKNLGAICIDMGGGTTGVSVFLEGEVIFTGTVALGGNHVTSDIARGLSTPLMHAERMKTLYGSAYLAGSDTHETIKVPLIGEDEAEENQIPRAMLVEIIRPRIEEIFELVRAKLDQAGLDRSIGRRLVLTGGASQLDGVRRLASEMLGKQARRGRPQPLRGLPEAASGPSFASVVGLVQYAMACRQPTSFSSFYTKEAPSNRLGRFGQWLRDNI
jgi:cell division protein FtsA